LKKEHQGDSFQIVKYGNLEAQEGQRSCKEYDEEKTNITAAKFCWIRLSLLTSVVVMLFKTGETYYN